MKVLRGQLWSRVQICCILPLKPLIYAASGTLALIYHWVSRGSKDCKALRNSSPKRRGRACHYCVHCFKKAALLSHRVSKAINVETMDSCMTTIFILTLIASIVGSESDHRLKKFNRALYAKLDVHLFSGFSGALVFLMILPKVPNY